MNFSPVKRLVLTAIHIALCVVLPIAFHSIPSGGAIFCPMHIPVLLCGMLCGPYYGLLCGALGPLLSALLTSMPAAAILPAMLLELAVYGFASGLLLRRLRLKSPLLKLYTALIAAMLLGRVFSGIAKAFIFSVGNYSLQIWLTASFITALPGIAIQLALIPSLLMGLKRAGLIAFEL